MFVGGDSTRSARWYTSYVAGIQHLSMRVPWRDRPWDQFICDDPLGNSSCTLLAVVGKGRDDSFEVASAGAAIDTDRGPASRHREQADPPGRCALLRVRGSLRRSRTPVPVVRLPGA
jgi:hypothetical protein